MIHYCSNKDSALQNFVNCQLTVFLAEQELAVSGLTGPCYCVGSTGIKSKPGLSFQMK